MLFRFRVKFAGDHAHIAIFAGPDADHLGKAGDICLRETELSVLKMILQFGGICTLVRDGQDAIIDCSKAEPDIRGPLPHEQPCDVDGEGD